LRRAHLLRGSDDTIAAISSAAGHAARGIIRLSGPDAVTAAEQVFSCSDGRCPGQLPGHARVLGRLRIGRHEAVPAELYLFRAPASYTGQDLVELHTVGSPPLLLIALESLLSAGARPAEAGEFTARAFLGGKLDLAQAEGVAAAVAGESDAQLVAAGRLLDGVLSSRVGSIRDELADLVAVVEAGIDFSEEGIEFITPADAGRRVGTIRSQIDTLLSASVAAERLETLPEVMLVGPANVGKSSLMNRLTGLDRSICSPLAGTTRDVLTAPLDVEGVEVLLVDAAGLVGGPATELDDLAVQAARRAAERAALLIFVVDLADRSFANYLDLIDRLPKRPMLVAANKIDLVAGPQIDACRRRIAARVDTPVVTISALTGQGCDRLVEAMRRALISRGADVAAEAIALNARHRRALEDSLAAVRRADALAAAAQPLDQADLLALELREAMHHLGTVVGQVVTEDLLDRIFANFCIGK
jgi:tRNA modification GTPase